MGITIMREMFEKNEIKQFNWIDNKHMSKPYSELSI